MSGKKMNEKSINSALGATAPEIIVGEDQSIEIPTHELGEAVSQEAFMNEVLTIEVAETTNENEPPSITLSVNGITQPVFRGYPTRVRRKYVEVLARCKETKYNQRNIDPSRPDKIELEPRTGLVYNFQVIEDPNPKGRAWLRAVLAEPA